MTIKKMGFKWYVISTIAGTSWDNRYICKTYMYYTKKEAIKMFKESLKNNN